jgi:hypothetical protein
MLILTVKGLLTEYVLHIIQNNESSKLNRFILIKYMFTKAKGPSSIGISFQETELFYIF